MAIRVHSLYTYPVKSCRGIQVSKVAVTSTGFRYDRHWVVVSADSGKFVTQRNTPLLSQVVTHLPEEALDVRAKHTLHSTPEGLRLTLSASSAIKGGDPGAVQVPLAVEEELLREGHIEDIAHSGSSGHKRRLVKASVWEWTGLVLDEGDEVAQWLSAVVEKPVRLVRYLGDAADSSQAPPSSSPLTRRRAVDRAFAEGYETAFSDGYPITLASEVSRRVIESESDGDIPMNRFRANLVVSGDTLEAFAEDAWLRFSVGAAPSGERLEMACVKPCSRCGVPLIDQDTGVSGKAPWPALTKLRSGAVLAAEQELFAERPRWKGKVFFSWNVVTKSDGVVSVDDPLCVLEHR